MDESKQQDQDEDFPDVNNDDVPEDTDDSSTPEEPEASEPA